ncbi:cell growth-regulating nucleolar protein [Cyanistes caeruleus]|uniref:Cell growth-regulating nucleolar protein n=1 Tax=Cyanistes caeruleus TaxID=156563 RepID=A0A8C0VSE1_CYACU|nr:cell growth-regulating nucleolar protein [Cyanistes caeruleus]XP_023781273.1 cell growth-regulating nucleolar protein [Cyanistes caeruleus]XP_023781275.1 cell growth-regulating nucleolar protein [Cyanistes caeruleus]
MVVFTCNACGEAVKKAQVEKHVNICRNCQCLSCMDCGKDFWGDDYKEHVKCVSEDQKYGGKGFEAKTNKGDAKQQEWIQKIHEVMKKPNISPKVRNILEQMRVFNNIPRKKVKFQNWIKNSLRINDSNLQDQVWDVFSEATGNISNEKEQDKPQQKEEQESAETGENTKAEENRITEAKTERKKSKRERKEERQKNKKKEKKDLKLENQAEVKKSKKSKKGKESVEDEFEINGNGNHSETEEETNVKKRKHKHVEEEPHTKTKRMKTESISEDMETENINDNEEDVGTDKGKFNWKGTIKAVLKQAPDNEISIKKLRKKVIAQYYAVAGEQHKTEEEILVIFNKKVKNNPKFRVLKEKVKLVK